MASLLTCCKPCTVADVYAINVRPGQVISDPNMAT